MKAEEEGKERTQKKSQMACLNDLYMWGRSIVQPIDTVGTVVRVMRVRLVSSTQLFQCQISYRRSMSGTERSPEPFSRLILFTLCSIAALAHVSVACRQRTSTKHSANCCNQFHACRAGRATVINKLPRQKQDNSF